MWLQRKTLLHPTSKGAISPGLLHKKIKERRINQATEENKKVHPMQAERAKEKQKKYADNVMHFKGW